MRFVSAVVTLIAASVCCAASPAQLLGPTAPQPPSNQAGNPLTNPQVSPGIEMLYQLEAQFAADTAKGGGPAFASWFAPDAVTLANGKPALIGHDAIAASATWTPASYQLTWKPEGARIAESGDMGYTWGHYDGVSKDSEGNAVKTSGRYMTLWKKQSDGKWKVEVDASNDGPAADCCSLH
ncbi:MAG TPA: nuclear transport factor 2 family protein [Acidobacteriaceae bacterium]|nr:nuclear transport factor 2 family protein [Acidobacteriaceae bacterium]